MASRLNGHEFEKIQDMVKNREAWRAAVRGVAEVMWLTSSSGDPCTDGPHFISLLSIVDTWLTPTPWPPRVKLL